MRPQNVIIGALAGLAAGALIGVLFAPDKGSDSRQKIVRKGEDYLDSIKKSFNSLLDSMSIKFNNVKEEVADTGEARKSKREMQASAS